MKKPLLSALLFSSTVGFLSMTGCSASQEEASAASSSALSSECDPASGGYNGKTCGGGGAGPGSFCWRGECRRECGVGILEATDYLICGPNASCVKIAGFYPGNGNEVGGLCYGSILPGPEAPVPYPSFGQLFDDDAIKTCDNNTRQGQCARGAGNQLFICAEPGGRSQTSPSGRADVGYQWVKCSGSASSCGCSNAASFPAGGTCDNNVRRGACASDGTHVYQCVNPGGASAANARSSQWKLCNKECNCP